LLVADDVGNVILARDDITGGGLILRRMAR